MRDEAALFAAQAAEAFVLKTASSIDDVLWFAKFLTRERSRVERGRNIFVYCVICLLQTMLAFLIARSGEEALDAWVHLHHFSSERLLTCIAAGGLGLYSIKLLLEEFEEREMCCYAPKEGYEQTPTSEKKPFPSKYTPLIKFRNKLRLYFMYKNPLHTKYQIYSKKRIGFKIYFTTRTNIICLNNLNIGLIIEILTP